LSESLSCLNVNSQHNQDFLDKTISDVVSTYLWSTDFINSRLSSDEDLIGHWNQKHTKTTTNKSTPWNVISNETTNNFSSSPSSPLKQPQNNQKKLNNDQNGTSFTTPNNNTNNNNNKLVIPVLDLSKLDINNDSKTSTEKNPSFSTSSGSKTIKQQQQQQQQASKMSLKSEIEYLLKELKLNKCNLSEINEYFDQESDKKLNKIDLDKLNLMAVNLRDLLSRLLEKRKVAKRCTLVEKMTKDEISVEKIDTQKELLAFEEKHGRPQSKIEKDLMRPLYDHYRKVKRLLEKIKNNNDYQQQQQQQHLQHHQFDDNDHDNDNFLRDQKNFSYLYSLNL
jgi:hypothetical protein